jgi:hypothetical protein
MTIGTDMTCRFKPLNWIKRDSWFADTPASEFDYIAICYEDGKYWASWDLSLPGTTDLEALKLAAQVWHNEWLSEWIETTPTAVEPWEDRMGGQFTQEEIARAERGGEGW